MLKVYALALLSLVLILPLSPFMNKLHCSHVSPYSLSVGIGHGSGLEENVEGRVFGKIPAFEEVLRFLPEWAVSSKQDDGLVEVLTPFSI